MQALVTGASGFVGAAVARALLAAGHRVRVLLRAQSSRRNLAQLEVEPVIGDLADVGALEAALAGCQALFHVAADYRLWAPDPQLLYRSNVDGTRNIIEAARRSGVARMVYTSSVATIGLRADAQPSDETDVAPLDAMIGHYKRSKFLAENWVQQAARAGAPIVIVNPSTPIGPGDVKPTPTGQVIVDYLNRRMPAYLETGLNWVHVRDVAVGHVLAAEKGILGERYILGHREGNWTMADTFKILEEITGIPRPKVKIPYWFAHRVAEVNEMVSAVTRRPPRAPLAGVRMAKNKMWFDPKKAVTFLGMPQTPPKQAFADAILWFKSNGYVKK